MARDTRAAFEREIRKLMPQFAEAFLQAIADVKSTAQRQLIEAAIEAGDVEAVVRALQIPEQYFAPLDNARATGWLEGGAYVMSRLPKKPYPGSSRVLVVRFQGRNDRAERWLRHKSSSLIEGITRDQQDAVRKVIAEGAELGRGPRQTALEIVGRVKNGRRTGGILGLTSRQTDWVIARRAKLQDDGRPADQVQRMVDRYKNKLLRQRGETIARTETVAALNAGRFEALQQLVDTGAVASADQITLQWSATQDGRTRDLHREMNGDKIGLYGAFTSPRTGAQLRFPGDTGLGASGEDVINCRCYLQPKIDWLVQAV